MSINTQKSRERIKRSTLTGVVPTVPVSSDFTDGTWLNTDIRAGEFFYNIPDEKLWIGTNTVPLELTSSIGNTLADVLANGNTTSGTDIIVSTGDFIRDNGYNALLGLGSSYTALYYKDTNATPNESILQYSPDNSAVDIDGEQYSVALINRRNIGGATQHFNGLYIGNMNYDLHSPVLGLGLTGALLVTTDSLISASAINSAIIGGSGATINTSVTNSVILGGYGIVASYSNSVYVPDLYIQSGKSIKSSNGGGQIELDASGTAGNVLITTDNGGYGESYLDMASTYLDLNGGGVDYFANSGNLDVTGDSMNFVTSGLVTSIADTIQISTATLMLTGNLKLNTVSSDNTATGILLRDASNVVVTRTVDSIVGIEAQEYFDAQSGTTVVLAHTPKTGTFPQVFKGGQKLRAGAGRDYTISGTTITFNVALVTDDIEVNYKY